MYYVYVLQRVGKNEQYVGHTSNLHHRLKEHHSGKSAVTKNKRPYRLVYYEIYKTKNEAMKREYFLKTPQGGLLKHQLIAEFPTERLKEFL